MNGLTYAQFKADLINEGGLDPDKADVAIELVKAVAYEARRLAFQEAIAVIRALAG